MLTVIYFYPKWLLNDLTIPEHDIRATSKFEEDLFIFVGEEALVVYFETMAPKDP